VNSDPDLQQQIRDSVRTQNFVDTVALGRKCGFEFSQDDVYAVIKQDTLELSDFELEVVAGGVTPSAVMDQGGCERIVSPPNINLQTNVQQF